MTTTEEAIGGHTATRFTDDLEAMCDLVAKMSGLVEKRLIEAVAAFGDSDVVQAKSIAESDYKVNDLELEIDIECTRILALHQPVARDLRLVTVVLKMITDLERVGDEVEKIARQISIINKGGIGDTLLHKVRILGDKAVEIIHLALDDFVHLRTNDAKLHRMDQVIDDECQSLTTQLLDEMSKRSDIVQSLLAVIWCVRALERIGDHAKNIGEYTFYIVQGKNIKC